MIFTNTVTHQKRHSILYASKLTVVNFKFSELLIFP